MKVKEQLKSFWSKYGVAILIMIGFIIVACIGTIFKYTRYEATAFDLGIFTEEMKNTIHGLMSSGGLPLYSHIEGFSHFAIHFSPILMSLIPFYVIWQSPLTLLVAQAILTGVGGFLIYYFARMMKLSKKTSLFIEIVYFVNPLLWSLLIFDFHELAFAVPMVMIMIIGYFKKDWKLFGVGLILSVMIKEDLTLTVGLLGVLLFAIDWFKRKEKQYFIDHYEPTKRQHKINKYAVLMMLVAGCSIILAVALSWKASDGYTPQVLDFIKQRYGATISSPISSLPNTTFVYYLRHTFDIYSIGQLFAYFAPLCFLPLFSIEWAIPAICILIIAMISTWGGQHNFINQYATSALPYLFTGMVLTFAKTKEDKNTIEIKEIKTENWKLYASGFIIAFSLIIIYLYTPLTNIGQMIGPAFDPNSQKASSDLNQVINSIPKGTKISVTANNNIEPHLVVDNDPYLAHLQYGFVNSVWGYPDRLTDYVLVDTNFLMSQLYSVDLFTPGIHNWDKETNFALESDNRYELVDKVNDVSLWKLK
jgi:uncharacterized membrane protein